jgi:hypothetical protein
VRVYGQNKKAVAGHMSNAVDKNVDAIPSNEPGQLVVGKLLRLMPPIGPCAQKRGRVLLVDRPSRRAPGADPTLLSV